MDLVAGGVLHGRLPSRPLRFPLVLRSLPSPTVAVSDGAALPGCPCPPIVRRNAPAVVPFAKKKRKGYIDDPPDEAAADGLVDELEEDEEVEAGEDFDDDDEDIMDEEEDYDFEDDFESDDKQDLYVGDGGAGGGISLAGTWWDKEALALAEQVSASFDDDLKIYAFKTAANLTIRVRIEKMSTRYGSPTIDDIEAYTIAYLGKLDDAESAGKIPQNISLEVSSPGVERVVRIPEELERFKERAMYVRYTTTSDEAATPQEGDGVLRLISYDMDLGECTWCIADVKINRQQAGKGRPLSKKQREWRLQTPFESLKLVRLYSEC
ncbi:uncharacterized protein LOC120681419 [Panicum virgatum]|uniref:DUF7912 domain-containing protein n=1 Tax=Panicum virgatum TaxID=38727 RepID=A0A8T0Q147_PANVG|nr:uncharacterized protein LOC120681419 [Panicum virgatum]KAG2566329.1 hypothetical protein PVAP13_7NG269051 [Panicum virgatum]